MKLNCDIGEGFGAWTMGEDARVMPLIDQANIACGFHASDPSIMVRTVAMARDHGVEIGAHPSYHDLAGFGRRSIPHSHDEVRALIWYQVGALEAICRAAGTRVRYIKPHGALNNDMMRNPALLQVVLEAVAGLDPSLPLMIPSTLQAPEHRQLANTLGVTLWFEAFADRAYDDQGQLVSRRSAGAVLEDVDAIVAQALRFATKGGTVSQTGQWLALPADSLCVHGDNDAALAAVRKIREALSPAADRPSAGRC